MCKGLTSAWFVLHLIHQLVYEMWLFYLRALWKNRSAMYCNCCLFLSFQWHFCLTPSSDEYQEAFLLSRSSQSYYCPRRWDRKWIRSQFYQALSTCNTFFIRFMLLRLLFYVIQIASSENFKEPYGSLWLVVSTYD